MARLLEEAHWLYEKDVSSVLFPRSYNLSREPKAFLDDFRLTAAAGLLKWFVGRMQDGQGFSESGHRPILMSRLEFAIKRCEEFIAREIHQNIDKDFVTEFSEEEWNSFLDDYTAAVHEGAGIETTSEKSRDQLQVRYSCTFLFFSSLLFSFLFFPFLFFSFLFFSLLCFRLRSTILKNRQSVSERFLAFKLKTLAISIRCNKFWISLPRIFHYIV